MKEELDDIRMRIAFSALIAVHALIHGMSFARDFGLAFLTQLNFKKALHPGIVLWIATHFSDVDFNFD